MTPPSAPIAPPTDQGAGPADRPMISLRQIKPNTDLEPD